MPNGRAWAWLATRASENLVRVAVALLLALPACSGSPEEAGPSVVAPPSLPGVPCGGDTPGRADGGSWACTWSDEFDGSALAASWELIPYGLGSACLFNDPEYARLSGGELLLTAKRLPTSHWCVQEFGLEYGGAGIQTQGSFAQQYGRFEVRAQMPPGAGFWPAFWLLPDDDSFDGEIDVVEVYGGRGIQGDATLHAPAAGPGPQGTCDIAPDYSTGFHTYTLEWEPGRMRFLFDDTLCAEFTGLSDAGTAPPSLAVFDKPYHLLLSLAVQPFWPPEDATPFPGVMRVDYVRVWR